MYFIIPIILGGGYRNDDDIYIYTEWSSPYVLKQKKTVCVLVGLAKTTMMHGSLHRLGFATEILGMLWV